MQNKEKILPENVKVNLERLVLTGRMFLDLLSMQGNPNPTALYLF